jgi:hypothetical protein
VLQNDNFGYLTKEAVVTLFVKCNCKLPLTTSFSVANDSSCKWYGYLPLFFTLGKGYHSTFTFPVAQPSIVIQCQNRVVFEAKTIAKLGMMFDQLTQYSSAVSHGKIHTCQSNDNSHSDGVFG